MPCDVAVTGRRGDRQHPSMPKASIRSRKGLPTEAGEGRIGPTPWTARCSSMNAIPAGAQGTGFLSEPNRRVASMAWTGSRAPPRRDRRSPCAGSGWRGAARGPPAPRRSGAPAHPSPSRRAAHGRARPSAPAGVAASPARGAQVPARAPHGRHARAAPPPDRVWRASSFPWLPSSQSRSFRKTRRGSHAHLINMPDP